MARLRKYAFWVWLLLDFVALFGLCSGAGHRHEYRTLDQLERDGVLVEAKVVARRQEGGSNKEPEKYTLSYRFRVGSDIDGEEVTREDDVDYYRWMKAQEGDTVTARYSRSDPRLWDVPTGRTAADALARAQGWFRASIVTGVMSLLVGMGLLYVKYRSPRVPGGRDPHEH